VNGGVEVLPDEGVMLHVPNKENCEHNLREANALLYVVLLSNNAGSKITDPVYRYNTNVLYGSQEVLNTKH
jgi:hypothetical protein